MKNLLELMPIKKEKKWKLKRQRIRKKGTDFGSARSRHR